MGERWVGVDCTILRVITSGFPGDFNAIPGPVGSRAGETRRGKLLISSHFLSFPIIPLVDGDGGRLGLRLRLHPHPHLLPSREKGSAKGTGGSDLGPIWPWLASFTLSRALELRPEWPRLALRSLVSVEPQWPRVASSRVATSGETFLSVAFSCIWVHFLPFHPSSSPSPKGDLCIATLPPARSTLTRCFASTSPYKGEVPAFAGTTVGVRCSDACNHGTGWVGLWRNGQLSLFPDRGHTQA